MATSFGDNVDDQSAVIRQEAALLERDRAKFMARPSVMLGIVPVLDGNAYIAKFASQDLQGGVAGSGDTAEEAMKDFDRDWFSKRELKARTEFTAG